MQKIYSHNRYFLIVSRIIEKSTAAVLRRWGEVSHGT